MQIKNIYLKLLLAFAAVLILPMTDSMGAHSADFSGVNGGSIIIGSDANACTSPLQGALRYESTSKVIQVCTDKLGSYQWTDWGD